ncbi:hypothetical protein TYRP_006387 [Tyrophagus putrescentiae]|nr:hypothetical protein TYRP_006387 [Tyrophagus putrescentiae]
MKSTAPFFHFIFILYYLELPLPNFTQPLDWDDAYLQSRHFTPKTMAAVERPFARFTTRMNAHPQEYGNDILFPNFYPQLAACTRPTGNNGALQLTEACDGLLIFLRDLDLMPGRYRRNLRARPPVRPWFELELDWLAFYQSLQPPAASEQQQQQQIEPLVTDHLVEVPPELVPLLNSHRLHLDFFPDGSGAATVSYRSLMAEFMRNQAVHATKEVHNRKRTSFILNTVARNRALKLKAIYLLMVGEDLEGEGENAGAQVEPQQPIENAVVEEQQQHHHQDQPPPLSPNDHDTDFLSFLDSIDYSDWPTEDDGQNAEDDHQLTPTPAPSIPAALGLHETLPENDGNAVSGQRRPLEDEDDDPENCVYGSNSSQQKEQDEETISDTTMATNDDV